MGIALMALILPVPASDMVIAMPIISSKSAVPETVSAFIAVLGFSRLRSSSMAKSVHNSPSQKNSVKARWSESSAPNIMEKLAHKQN